jgi:hypothetical protein
MTEKQSYNQQRKSSGYRLIKQKYTYKPYKRSRRTNRAAYGRDTKKIYWEKRAANVFEIPIPAQSANPLPTTTTTIPPGLANI